MSPLKAPTSGFINPYSVEVLLIICIWMITSSKTERACTNRNARLLDFVRYGWVRVIKVVSNQLAFIALNILHWPLLSRQKSKLYQNELAMPSSIHYFCVTTRAHSVILLILSVMVPDILRAHFCIDLSLKNKHLWKQLTKNTERLMTLWMLIYILKLRWTILVLYFKP